MARSYVTPTKTPKFFTFAAVCLLVTALYFAQEVIIPIALSIVLSFLLTPLVARLEKWGLPRIPSVLTVVCSGCLGLIALGWVVWVQTSDLADQLPQYKQNIVDKIKRIQPANDNTLHKAAKAAEEIQRAVSETTTAPTTENAASTQASSAVDKGRLGASKDAKTDKANNADPAPMPVRVVPTEPSTFESLRTYLGPILNPLATAGIVIVFVIFILLQREDLRDRVIRLLGQGRLNLTTTALDDATSRISRYLLAQSIVNGTYGAAISIGLLIIGYTLGGKTFPNFVLWGLLCALLRFIPYIGPWIAAAFPLAIGFAVFPGYGVFIAIISMIVFIELISNNFMEPWLYGSSTGMSAVAILVAAVFWTWLWGPIGLLLSTPLTVCLVVMGKYVPQLQFLDVMLGDEPVLAPPERIYQRLLAMDAEEASDAIDEFLKTMTLEEVYDTALMPALALAEQDRHRGRLDNARNDYIRDAMRDIVEDLGDRHRLMLANETPAETAAAAEATDVDAKSGNGEKVLPTKKEVEKAKEGPKIDRERPRLPKDCVVKVVCLPAHDEADELVGMMVAQLLELRGYCAYPISQNALASEMVNEVEKHDAHVVVVSALPPSAVMHARYLCKRLHARFPDVHMVVGLWTIKGDLAKAKARTACDTNVELTTTIGKCLDQIEQIAHPVIVQASNKADEKKDVAVATIRSK